MSSVPKNHKVEIILSGVRYRLAELGVVDLSNAKDIYYHPKENANSDIGFDINHGKQAGRLDHISFHNDGSVHGTYKRKNRKAKNASKPPLREKIGSLGRPLVPQDKSTETLLLHDTIYKTDGLWPLPQLKPEPDSPIYWSFSDISSFKILVYLVHESKNIYELYKNSDVVDKFFQVIPVFDEWQIILLLSLDTRPMIAHEAIIRYNPQAYSKPEFIYNRIIGVPSVLGGRSSRGASEEKQFCF